MRPVKPWMLLAAWVLGALTFAPLPDVGGITIPWVLPIGNSPSFLADKLTVLILENETVAGRQALVGEQDDIMRSLADDGVRQQVLKIGGRFEVLSATNKVEFDNDAIKAAFSVADKTHLPSIVASDPKHGIKAQPLPMTMADAKKLLSPLGVK